jgi:hypothetical protein
VEVACVTRRRSDHTAADILEEALAQLRSRLTSDDTIL